MSQPDPLLGLHHVSALTARPADNLSFYTRVLGLRLVLKTVNQDDPSSYHLFYADEQGSPGTEVTFFHTPNARNQRPGTGLISGVSLRVRGRDALDAWAARLDEHDVRRTAIHTRGGRRALTLFDDEEQTLHLVDDADEVDRVPDTQPWTGGDVPASMAVQGLGPVEVTVADLDPTREVLTDILGFAEVREYRVETPPSDATTESSVPSPDHAPRARVFSTGPGGVASEIHVVERPDEPRGWLGIGGVHHLALRTPNGESLQAWRNHIAAAGLDVTPVIDRHYFESAYVREPGGILIEIATDTGAGFPIDEAEAGSVSLPPFLEPRREEIENELPPIGSSADSS